MFQALWINNEYEGGTWKYMALDTINVGALAACQPSEDWTPRVELVVRQCRQASGTAICRSECFQIP